MRMIIHEQPYETPIAAGVLRYEQDGKETGAVEKWRLTTAVSGYTVLRVDLDARFAPSGNTTLYHLVLNQKGHPERLRYRFWNKTTQVAGNLLFEATQIFNSHDDNGERREEEQPVPSGYGFWFPATSGLRTLIGLDNKTAVSLNNRFALYQTEVSFITDAPESFSFKGKMVSVQPLTIAWQDQRRTLWLDAHQWPLKMQRGDGLTAVATRYIRYENVGE